MSYGTTHARMYRLLPQPSHVGKTAAANGHPSWLNLSFNTWPPRLNNNLTTATCKQSSAKLRIHNSLECTVVRCLTYSTLQRRRCVCCMQYSTYQPDSRSEGNNGYQCCTVATGQKPCMWRRAFQCGCCAGHLLGTLPSERVIMHNGSRQHDFASP